MDVLELMRLRHSVRSYKDVSVDSDTRAVIYEYVATLNKEYGTNVQAFFDDPDCFANASSQYGVFSGCKNYAVLVGKDAKTCGYVGELIALKLQSMGLNTCFVALTYKRGAVKSKVKLNGKEKIQCNLAFGYGVTGGFLRRSKTPAQVSVVEGEKPALFDKVVEACLLAPTAINQQKFAVVAKDGQIFIKKRGIGFYTDVDLGIVEAHKDLILGNVTL